MTAQSLRFACILASADLALDDVPVQGAHDDPTLDLALHHLDLLRDRALQKRYDDLIGRSDERERAA